VTGGGGAPRPASPVDAAADELERSLTSAGRAILRLGVPAEALRPGERVDRSGYWVLQRLDEVGGPVHLSTLAALLELDLSTVSRQVRPLVSAGLVTRSADPGDGRACLLALSARGRGVLASVREARRDVLRQALAGWGAAERAAIADALTRLAADLQTVPGDVPSRRRSGRSGEDGRR